MTSACGSYRGSATATDVAHLESERGWLRLSSFPEVRQRAEKDCGAAALTSVLRYHGYHADPAQILSELAPEPGHGSSSGALAELTTRKGLEAFVFYGTVDDLTHELEQERPVLVGVGKPYDTGEWRAHYEVIIGLNRESGDVLAFDPARALRKNTMAGFLEEWRATRHIAIVIFPAPRR